MIQDFKIHFMPFQSLCQFDPNDVYIKQVLIVMKIYILFHHHQFQCWVIVLNGKNKIDVLLIHRSV
jgi:hypothetical protein